MRKTLLAPLLAVIVAVSGLFSTAACADSAANNYLAGDPAEVAAVILHTNDVHVAFAENIGYDGLALYKKELERKYGSVFLADAGDFIQGGT